MPHPGVAVLLLEYLRDCPAAIACARRGVVHFDWVRPAEGVGVAVPSVGASAAIGVVPPGLHAAVALPKVGVRAIARPYIQMGMSSTVEQRRKRKMVSMTEYNSRSCDILDSTGRISAAVLEAIYVPLDGYGPSKDG